jgi:hypothetical protein
VDEEIRIMALTPRFYFTAEEAGLIICPNSTMAAIRTYKRPLVNLILLRVFSTR